MPGPLTLGEIASRLGGRVAGDAATVVSQVAPLQSAGQGQIAFLADPKYRSILAGSRAAAVILSPDHEAMTALPRIVTPKPYLYFARVSQLFNPRTVQPAGVHPAATVAASAKLGPRVSIGAGCVVGEGVTIGEDSCLYPRVVVYPGCTIGARTIVQSGAVIGGDGFGFAEDDGKWVKIPQIGSVRIGDDVEIGANTTIDRGTMSDTVIEDGVKLDNQIQVGHNVRIGAHTAVQGCAGIAGSTDIGKGCVIGAAAGILGHLKIADGVRISACTTISSSISEPGTYTGLYPFEDNRTWARNTAVIRRLSELWNRVRALEGKGKKNG
jgi:UDP-3-O-[3-hydroxymyristoyl] glucosamine N-acyltransferase